MTYRKRQQGFGVIGIITLVVIVAVIGVGGWYVWSKQQPSSDKSPSHNPATSNNSTQQTKLVLASNHAVFTLPDGWSASTQHVTGEQCLHTLAGKVSCLDQTTIFPDAAGKVNGAPAYSATVAIYERGSATSAKAWWQNYYDASNDSGTVDGGALTNPSTVKIASYDAYQFTSQSNDRETIWYIIAAQNNIALITATIKQPGATLTAPVRDYSDYVPALQTFTNSVKFQ